LLPKVPEHRLLYFLSALLNQSILLDNSKTASQYLPLVVVLYSQNKTLVAKTQNMPLVDKPNNQRLRYILAQMWHLAAKM
jgi:hypothetical protein